MYRSKIEGLVVHLGGSEERDRKVKLSGVSRNRNWDKGKRVRLYLVCYACSSGSYGRNVTPEMGYNLWDVVWVKNTDQISRVLLVAR